MKTLQNTVYESSTGLPFVTGAKYKLPKFGHPQKIKVWLLGLNKTRLPWQLPLLSFFIACYTFLARFCYVTFCMVWQVFGKTFKDSKSAWRKWFFIGFFRSIYLTRSFFAYFSNLLWWNRGWFERSLQLYQLHDKVVPWTKILMGGN